MTKSEARADGGFSWPLAFTLVALIAAAVAIFIFWRLETWPARTVTQGADDLERLGKDLRSAFVDIGHLQPRITINNRTVIDQPVSTAELVVLTRETKVKREFLHTWAGSSKRIKLSGIYNVKAGFNLQQDVTVDVRPDEIIVRLPHAEILGVEQKRLDVLTLENGLWNKISGADLQNELAKIPQIARQQGLEANLADEAEQELRRQLSKRIRVKQPLRLIFAETSQVESPVVNQ